MPSDPKSYSLEGETLYDNIHYRRHEAIRESLTALADNGSPVGVEQIRQILKDDQGQVKDIPPVSQLNTTP